MSCSEFQVHTKKSNMLHSSNHMTKVTHLALRLWLSSAVGNHNISMLFIYCLGMDWRLSYIYIYIYYKSLSEISLHVYLTTSNFQYNFTIAYLRKALQSYYSAQWDGPARCQPFSNWLVRIKPCSWNTLGLKCFCAQLPNLASSYLLTVSFYAFTI